ncbi:hypothetical protein [Methylobrevis albus]|uniref:Uncharacterized protein n=1 Tax=Methylobrevis albus TaxID=2793297 RepID=A0A931MWA1_9HYPH|nr:hypothetical protein [Methylobrevis albus]MBH0236453.1 hypothetical protein [Methylobrevis albus]
MPRPARDLILGGLMLAAAFAGGGAAAVAEPLRITTEADVEAFAKRVKTFALTSGVRWVIAAPTQRAANRLVAAVRAELGPAAGRLSDRLRVEAMTTTDAPSLGPASGLGGAVVAWAETVGEAEPQDQCRWRVVVTDPELPTADGRPLGVALVNGDTMPVSGSASLRIDGRSFLQASVYAFGETRPGHIRNLADVGEIDIPVDVAEGPEQITLVEARRQLPVLEGIREKLAGAGGSRRDLGRAAALGSGFGRPRGIGANIQIVDPAMVVSKREPAAPDGAALAQTCTYALVPGAG